ncbi:MAG: gas vesicle protein K [Chloroflexi bacterium]|nr:gas vesicle protein K [Chloroflexota bacterium]
MAVHINETNLKQGVLGLAMALIEVIRDALQAQALRRVESGRLTESECERLGRALMELDAAIRQVEEEQGIAESVQTLRQQLDKFAGDLIDGPAGLGEDREKA